MKSIGIVRQVDELGRVVIPKELRDALGIGWKDPLEILITRLDLSHLPPLPMRPTRPSKAVVSPGRYRCQIFVGQPALLKLRNNLSGVGGRAGKRFHYWPAATRLTVGLN